jgi:hypothetical protein
MFLFRRRTFVRSVHAVVASVKENSRKEESGRFLKKAVQKLLLCWAMGGVGDAAHGPA